MTQTILDYKSLIKDLASKLSFEYLDLDLIISPGGFNIFYALAISDLLKELQNQNKLKVHRIMGASAGALAGLFYFSNLNSDIFINHYNDMKSHFDKYKNVNMFFDYIDKYIIDSNILNQINNKLYICYHKCESESRFPTFEIKSMFETLD
jgi:predicted acylesterase/phospholipase RssA